MHYPPCCGILIHRRHRAILGRVTGSDVRSAGARKTMLLAAQPFWVGSGLYQPTFWRVDFPKTKALEGLPASGGSF
jgi:hypothetical protein